MPWSIPRFNAAASFTGVATGNTFNISSPACDVGDYLLGFLVTNKDTITPDAKFTLIQQDLDSANPWSCAIYKRTADATDQAGTTYTWNLSAVTAAPNTMVIMSYKGVDPNNVVIAKAYTALTTNPVTTPTVTSTRPSLIVCGNACRNSAGSTIKTFTEASGTERFDGGNHGTVSYMHAYEDNGTTSYTIGANTGVAITISDTTNLADRMSYTVSLGARWENPVVISQSLDRASRW